MLSQAENVARRHHIVRGKGSWGDEDYTAIGLRSVQEGANATHESQRARSSRKSLQGGRVKSLFDRVKSGDRAPNSYNSTTTLKATSKVCRHVRPFVCVSVHPEKDKLKVPAKRISTI